MIKRPSLPTLLLLALVGLSGGARAAELTARPFVGVTHIARSESMPRPVSLNVVLIDLAAPGISFLLSSPGGTRDTVRQTTLDFLNHEQAQVAINVHFFVPYPSAETDVDVVGLAVSRGKAYSPFEPQPVAAGFVDQSYAILPFAPALNIDRSNRVTVVHYDTVQAGERSGLENPAVSESVTSK